MPFYQIFMRILSEGRPLGVHVVATADRSGSVPTAVSSNVSRRIVLRLADENAYALVNAPKDVLDERSAPGRAIVDGFETQIAVLGGTPNVAEQTKILAKWAQDLRVRGAREVAEIGALPTRLERSIFRTASMGCLSSASRRIRSLPGGSTRWALRGHRPAESGKTNAMKALITSMVRLDPGSELFHLGGRRAQLKQFAPWTRSATTVDEAKDLVTELAELVADEASRRAS